MPSKTMSKFLRNFTEGLILSSRPDIEREMEEKIKSYLPRGLRRYNRIFSKSDIRVSKLIGDKGDIKGQMIESIASKGGRTNKSRRFRKKVNVNKSRLNPQFKSRNSKIEQKGKQMSEFSELERRIRQDLPKNEYIRNLRPHPTQESIDLGKINKLINNPHVKSIECTGPNQSLLLRTSRGKNKSGISLTNEEINGILEKFSEKANIPIEKGIFRAVVGKFSITAVVSESVGSRFIIREIPPVSHFR